MLLESEIESKPPDEILKLYFQRKTTRKGLAAFDEKTVSEIQEMIERDTPHNPSQYRVRKLMKRIHKHEPLRTEWKYLNERGKPKVLDVEKR
ncbi:MAG: hypothetical protein ABEJ98_03545 [Candidatus Nanohaloarchaea archaeon]